ncbi:hypothetical protein BDB00DRAFT_856172, partial [Zychaea mexicana]|uniref:uncharacterized protein n=1 Tax=Zychaea mexicana TaxID=64656 RepID=UPI0022FF2978
LQAVILLKRTCFLHIRLSRIALLLSGSNLSGLLHAFDISHVVIVTYPMPCIRNPPSYFVITSAYMLAIVCVLMPAEFEHECRNTICRLDLYRTNRRSYPKRPGISAFNITFT